MFLLILLGSKKISVIACGQTSSMALSDAGEVGVKKDETRKCLPFISLSVYHKQVNTSNKKTCTLHKHVR